MSAELSYTDQSGNRQLRVLTGGINVSHLQKDAFRLDGSVQSRYGESENEVVARNHYASLAFDLHPEDTWSPFLFADAERDPFKRLDARASGGAGAKYTIFREENGTSRADASLALLYSYENRAAAGTEPAPSDRHLARWSLRVRGNRQLTPGIELSHVSFVQPAWGQLADYLLRSETGAKILLMERLALSVEYQLNRNARPLEGVEPDDRLFKTGLIIDF